MVGTLPKNLTGTSCCRVLASALQRYQASRAVHASARKYNQLFSRIYSLASYSMDVSKVEFYLGEIGAWRHDLKSGPPAVVDIL